VAFTYILGSVVWHHVLTFVLAPTDGDESYLESEERKEDSFDAHRGRKEEQEEASIATELVTKSFIEVSKSPAA
jgi:hypothetical protein